MEGSGITVLLSQLAYSINLSWPFIEKFDLNVGVAAGMNAIYSTNQYRLIMYVEIGLCGHVISISLV